MIKRSAFLCLCAAASVLACTTAVVAAPAAPSTAVLIENVRIFDGQSARLSGPSNVLVVGNVIQSISSQPLAPPAGARSRASRAAAAR